MIRRFVAALAVASGIACLAGAPSAEAHPHVILQASGEFVVSPDGKLTAVKHRWTFDEGFSSYAVQGLDKNGDGKLSREELAELAETNVTSLKEFDFFTFMKADGKPVAFQQPVDYWLDHDGAVLTLNFTLPLQTPLPLKGVATDFQVYDPSFFVAFGFKGDKPMAIAAGAPAACTVAYSKPKADPQSQQLSEAFFQNLDPAGGFAAQFASRIAVKCP